MQALDQKARASQPPVSQPSASKRKAESAPQDEAEAKAPKTGMPYTDAAHRQLHAYRPSRSVDILTDACSDIVQMSERVWTSETRSEQRSVSDHTSLVYMGEQPV